MKKGAIYARYSSDKQTEETIHVQLEKCRAFCEQEGILVCETFTDKGKSGTTEGGREAYQHMLEMARRGLFDAVIAYKFDRFGRSLVEAAQSFQELERVYDVEVYSATEPALPLVRNILLSVAEDFSRQLGSRITDSLTNTAQRGFHCGGVAPYGYAKVKIDDPDGRTDHKGNLIQHVVFESHAEQAPIVRRIFQSYADGYGMKRVADSLNKEGISAPGGNTWDVSAVRYILLNETYRGWRIWNKTKKIRKPDGKKTYRHRPREEWVILEDAHPAIVDAELWEAVEAIRNRKVRLKSQKGGDRTAFSSYLLTGLVKCAECGGNFVVQKQWGASRARPHHYYRCSYHNRRGNAVCTNSTGLHRDRLENAVLDLLQQEVLTKETVQMIVEGVKEAWNTHQQEGPDKELKQTERELRKIDKELTHLVQAIKTTGISETLKDELERCEKRKAALQHSRQELQQNQPQTFSPPTEGEIKAALSNLSQVLESGTLQDRKAMMEENIEEIVVQLTGETILKVNPAGLLSLPDYPLAWCRRWDSNPHAREDTGF